MKNSTLILVTVVLITVVGAGVVKFMGKSDTQPSSADLKMMEKSEDDLIVKPIGSRYVEYSKTTLAQAARGRRVLYFYANWCPTYRPADANLRENEARIPENMIVVRVNYNDSDTDAEEKALAKQYGITYQHTFVQIDRQGKELTKWNGGQIEELLINII